MGVLPVAAARGDTGRAMSQENVEFVRRGYIRLNEMLKSGAVDHRAVEETWAPDCVLSPSGLLPETAEMHGHEGIVRFISAQAEMFEEMQVEVFDLIDADDRVVVPIRFGGKARHTGLDVTFAVVHVLTVRDGRVARLDMYADEAQALEAVGLRG
jgi:uncharacterized protein